MRHIVFISILFIALFSGCMSPRLGYPVETVEIPTPVTLHVTIIEKGTIVTEIGFLADSMFRWQFAKFYEDEFAKVDTNNLLKIINRRFIEKARSLPELFILEKGLNQENSSNTGVSLFGEVTSEGDFSSRYTLIFSVDEWGYFATNSENIEDEGPFVSVSIQLFDKEQTEAVWKYKSEAHQKIEELGDRGTHKAAYLEETYEKLILEQLDKYFKWLAAK